MVDPQPRGEVVAVAEAVGDLRRRRPSSWRRGIAKFGSVNAAKQVKGEEDEVDKHFGILKIEDRLARLEDRLAAIEKKGLMKMRLGCVCLIVVLRSEYANSLK
ncbi:hypothetical protein PIB30_077216 [Stylosanthes scabra]|uniref:Uncharacterized protein n=1 Tax=Stylosanthes scabra TaxID=79078 RepID=A0ABU6QQ32_9FABA|nr:hypothetical protein [Stylosanthes scabra]